MDAKLKDSVKKHAKIGALIGTGLSGVIGTFLVYYRFTENPEHLSTLGNAFDCGWRYAATVACSASTSFIVGGFGGATLYQICDKFCVDLDDKVNS